MEEDLEPYVFHSNTIPDAPYTSSAGFYSPPPSPRLRHHRHHRPQTSLLLQLPAELRALILVAAFGNRTIHADLDLVTTPLKQGQRPSTPPDGQDVTHPPPPPAAWTLTTAPHAPSSSSLTAPIDLASPQNQWKPCGHLCHRGCLAHHCHRQYSSTSPPPLFVVDRDRCFVGGDPCTQPDTGLGSCRIGALGWLLTCRQAHAEGIEVLYRRNTFRLNESFVLENLPRLFSTSCASQLTQLSLSLTMGRPRVMTDRLGYPRPRDTVEDLPDLLSLVPDVFPNLAKLHLVIAGELWPELQLAAYCAPSEIVHSQVEDMLSLLEITLRRLKMLRMCEIAFDSSVYFPWVQIEKDITIDFKDYADFEHCPCSVWRELSSDQEDELQLEHASQRQLYGLWVCLDAWDAIPWSVMTDLFGTGPW